MYFQRTLREPQRDNEIPATTRWRAIYYRLAGFSARPNPPTDHMTKKLLLPLLALTLLGSSCWTRTVNINATTANSNTNTVVCAPAAGSVTYAGQDGKNALELLQAGHQVDVTTEGFVNAIDAKKPGDRQFWAFYVNCKQAEIGAKDYQTKTSDLIEWKLESF